MLPFEGAKFVVYENHSNTLIVWSGHTTFNVYHLVLTPTPHWVEDDCFTCDVKGDQAKAHKAMIEWLEN